LAIIYAEAVIQCRNIIVSGGTGAGKTTLLGILADFIPDDDRIVLIEDTAELNIRKPNLVRFEARREQSQIPAVTICDLLKASLRHRPDRIIVGEVRGGEAFDLLQALNTGHSGSISTLHANSARQAVSRFADCVLQSGIEMPHRAIRSNIANSVDLILHIARVRGRRAIAEALRISSYDAESDQYQLMPLVETSTKERPATSGSDQ
jgi:pilus assembly protein CpaF